MVSSIQEAIVGRRFFALVLAATLIAEARANLANFNALTVGTIYSPGSLFSNGGLDFDVLFGLGNVTVNAASGLVNPSFTGNYLRLGSNNGLNVNLPAGASLVKFDFISGSSADALAINGAFLIFDQIPTTVNGVTVTHLLGSKTNPWGSVSASGPIDNFVIIGTQLLVDNADATLAAGLAGDYNKNLIVDAGDYVLWRKTVNSPSGYRTWRSNFGATGGIGTGIELFDHSVPEPSATFCTLLCLVWILHESVWRRH
jgi:hypothetical protein